MITNSLAIGNSLSASSGQVDFSCIYLSNALVYESTSDTDAFESVKKIELGSLED